MPPVAKKTVIPNHPKSRVWGYFGDSEDGETATCLLCKYTKKSATEPSNIRSWLWTVGFFTKTLFRQKKWRNSFRYLIYFLWIRIRILSPIYSDTLITPSWHSNVLKTPKMYKEQWKDHPRPQNWRRQYNCAVHLFDFSTLCIFIWSFKAVA